MCPRTSFVILMSAGGRQQRRSEIKLWQAGRVGMYVYVCVCMNVHVCVCMVDGSMRCCACGGPPPWPPLQTAPAGQNQAASDMDVAQHAS
jgi:hypothetical protein